MAAAYGPFVISDFTHYVDKDDLEELLRWNFPVTTAQPHPWKYSVDSSGDIRVWAPSAITQEEKEELYRKNRERRGESLDMLSVRRYRV